MSDKTFVEVIMAEEGSPATKRPMPSLSDDEVAIDACWFRETGEMADVDGGGTSTAIDNEVLHCRVAGLTKPVTDTTTDRQDKTKRKEFFMLVCIDWWQIR